MDRFMTGWGMVLAGIILIVLGLLFISGILQALITVVGWVGIVLGVVISIIGIIRVVRDRSKR